MAIVSLATYVYVNEDHVLTAHTAFSALTVLNMMTGSFTQLPHIVTNFIKALTGLNRIDIFLNKDVIDPQNITHTSSGKIKKWSALLVDVWVMQCVRLYDYACLLHERWVYVLCSVACMSLFSHIDTKDKTVYGFNILIKDGLKLWINVTLFCLLLSRIDQVSKLM